jgi:hypothetical protein
MTTPLPKLGTQQRLLQREAKVPNARTPDWSGWYPAKAANVTPTDPPTVTIDGEGGGVDIGGNPERPGRLVLRDQNGRITHVVDGQSGASDQLGDLVVSTFETENPGGSFQNVHERARISGRDGALTLKSKGVAGKQTVRLDGNLGDLVLGAAGVPGDVVVKDANDQPAVALDGAKGAAFVKSSVSVAKPQADAGVALDVNGKTQTTNLTVKQDAQARTLRVDSAIAVAKAQADAGIALDVNGKAQTVRLVVKQDTQTNTLHVASAVAIAKPQVEAGVALDVSGKTQMTSLVVQQDAQAGTLDVIGQTQTANLIVEQAALTLTLRVDGSIAVAKPQAASGTALDVNGTTQTENLVVSEKAASKSLRVNEQTQTGSLIVDKDAHAGTMHVDGHTTVQSLAVEGRTSVGELVAQNLTVEKSSKLAQTTVETLTINQVMALLKALRIEVKEELVISSSKGTTTLDGGDIRLTNADCAEDFDVLDGAEPGTVMVLGDSGALRQSTAAYDKRVAGVISGAGGYRPGLVLDKQATSDGCRMPVALMGKVFCKVDADQAPIEVGDLLTTSPTPGHAMKAVDPLRAFGAVIGKALRPLTAGQGLIPVLVALQ